MEKLIKKKTTKKTVTTEKTEEFEYYDVDSEDPIEDPTDPAPAADEKYPTGDYRAGIVKPQGGDDYKTGNFGTTGYEQPTSKSSNWNSDGDGLFPVFYENDKGAKVEMDMHLNEAIKGHYLVRVKVNDWPVEISGDDAIRVKVQLSDSSQFSNANRFWNLNSTKSINKLGVGNEYWFDVTANMVSRGLLVEGKYNVNGEVLYVYVHSANYSTGKMCIVRDDGGSWKREGTDWIDES